MNGVASEIRFLHWVWNNPYGSLEKANSIFNTKTRQIGGFLYIFIFIA